MENAICDLMNSYEKGALTRRQLIQQLTMLAGVGAASTTYGCINSHYYDPTKTTDGQKGIFRTKQAGRTGLGSVMIDKKIRSVIFLAEYPRGENPFGAADWDKAKKAGHKLSKVVKEVHLVQFSR